MFTQASMHCTIKNDLKRPFGLLAKLNGQLVAYKFRSDFKLEVVISSSTPTETPLGPKQLSSNKNYGATKKTTCVLVRDYISPGPTGLRAYNRFVFYSTRASRIAVF